MKRNNKFLCLLFLVGALSISFISKATSTSGIATFYFVSSCGNVIIFSVEEIGDVMAAAHNKAIELNSQDCGSGGPIPKIYMMAP